MDGGADRFLAGNRDGAVRTVSAASHCNRQQDNLQWDERRSGTHSHRNRLNTGGRGIGPFGNPVKRNRNRRMAGKYCGQAHPSKTLRFHCVTSALADWKLRKGRTRNLFWECITMDSLRAICKSGLAVFCLALLIAATALQAHRSPGEIRLQVQNAAFPIRNTTFFAPGAPIGAWGAFDSNSKR